MTYDNTNRGFLRKNDKKVEPNQPDYRGDINVNGEDFWISGWLAEHENMGGKYFQMSVQPKSKVYEEAKEAVKTTEIEDSDIPF